MTERTPSTRAGRDLLDAVHGGPPHGFGYDIDRDAILAIEAEARADAFREVGELRAALRKASDDLLNDEMGDLEHYHLDSRFREFARQVRGLAQPPAPDPT